MKSVFNRLFLIVSSIVMLSMMNSCGDGSASKDAEQLLKTVPSDSPVVMVINSESLMNKSGVEYKDNKFVLSEEISSLLDEKTRTMLSAPVGIRPTVVVGYLYRNTLVFTGHISDSEMFNNFLTEKVYEGSTEWQTGGSLGVGTKVVISDKRFWIASDDKISTETILSWEQMKEKESAYASNELVAAMSKLDKDIQYFYDVDRVMSSAGDANFEQKMMVNMLKEMLVKDCAYAAGWIDFTKDEIIADMRCYNSKFGPAEYVIEAQKIDTSLLKELPKNSKMVVAFGTTSKMWVTLCNSISQLTGNMISASEKAILDRVFDAVKGLDGTIIFGVTPEALQSGFKQGEMVAIVQTKDEAAARSLLTLVESATPNLPEGMSLTANGKMLRFTLGNISEFGMEGLKDKMSGNMTSVYVNGDFITNLLPETDFVESISASADSMDHGTMSIKIKENGSENVIKALINLASKHKSAEPEESIIY